MANKPNDDSSLSHTRWNCKYHIVFIPKYRRKEIFGKIRALSDVPGAFLYLNEHKLKIYKAKIISDEMIGKVGEIIKADKGGLFVQCNNGVLSLLDLQKEGKNRMDYKSFINGNQNLLGQILK